MIESANPQYDDELNFSKVTSFIIANAPDKITEFSQSLTNYISGKVNLIWTPPDDNGIEITHYIVSRDVGSGVFYRVYNGSLPMFTDQGLSLG